MRHLMRFVLGAVAALVALALAAPAMAAFSPRFEVLNPTKRSGAGGPVTLRAVISKDDDATFRIQFYVPQGYGVDLGKTPGTQIGTVSAQVNARAISPDAIVPVTGTVAAADPTAFRTLPSALGCTQGRSNFSAVLMLTVSAAGQTLQVPIYVFPTEPPFSTGYTTELAVCFPNPNIPQAQGGAALGIKIVDASITLTGVFMNPAAAGNYIWRSEWIPWSATAPNIAGFTEAQATDSLPAQLTVAAKFNTRTKRVAVTGRLTEGGSGAGGVRVRILVGGRPAGTATTRANGAYAFSYRVPKRFLGISDAHQRQARRVLSFSSAATVPTRTVPCVATLATETHPCSAATKNGYNITAVRAVRVVVK
jgi:hypothetical protein